MHFSGKNGEFRRSILWGNKSILNNEVGLSLEVVCKEVIMFVKKF